MSIKNLLDDYNLFVSNKNNKQMDEWPVFKPMFWHFEQQRFDHPQQLNEALKKLQMQQGWLTLPGEHVDIKNYDYQGNILAGQAANSARSVSIQWQRGADQGFWQMTTITPDSEASADILVCEEKQLCNISDYQYLVFETAWKNIDGAMRKVASRLTGVV